VTTEGFLGKRLAVLGIVGIAIGFAPLAQSATVSAAAHIAASSSSQPWQIVPSANTASSDSDQLQGISCPLAGTCVAAGFYPNAGVYHTLTESNAGAGWQVVSSPNTSSSLTNVLNGITCTSASNCWAVGYAANSAGLDATLIEQYNGSAWAIVSSPSSGADSVLSSVACVSASNCMAVGGYTNGATSPTQTLVEQWGGTSWTIVSSPNTSTTEANNLNSVTCLSTGDCWAVGVFYNGTGSSGNSQTLIEMWNGTTWSLQSSPDSSTAQNNGLQAVSCASSGSCMATGYYAPTSTTESTLIEQWNGGTWNIATSPNTSGAQYDDLFGVDCVGSNSCVAVGASNSGNWQTQSEVWNGTSWSIVATPDNGSTVDNVLYGVSCWDLGNCIAAGDYMPASNYQTLIEAYAAPTTTTYDDTSPSVSFDSWKGFADPTANGGSYRSDAKKGATATFKFSGKGVTWVTRKGPDQGIAAVTIDGKTKGNVDLYASTAASFSQSYAGLTSKTHTLVIKVTGTKNASSSNTNVAIDAFIVGLTTTQETSPKVAYDSWTGTTSSSALDGSYRSDTKAKATASLSFVGTSVTWFTATGPSEGMASVTIDGVNQGTVDLYAPSIGWQIGEVYAGLTSGPHTVVVKVLGTKNAASAGAQIAVDGFIVTAYTATWMGTGSLNVARGDDTATLLGNGDVLVVGGTSPNTNSCPLTSAELYDPATGTWSLTGSMATPRCDQTATLLSNGNVLVAGGASNAGIQASAELYHPTTGTWTTTGSMAAPRQHFTATLLANGDVLAVGGDNATANSPLASAEIYDPNSGTWSPTANLLPDGKVLVAGGLAQSGLLASAELFDPTSGTWTATGSMLTARYVATATLLDSGNVLVVGGSGNSGTLASAELYNPASETWTATGSLGTGRYFDTATLLPDGTVLVTGGNTGTSYLSSAELYNPDAGTWSSAGTMAVTRETQTATLLPDGNVLVAGGDNGSDLVDAELYG